MEIKIIVFGFVILLIFVGLCGCEEAGIPDNPDRVYEHNVQIRTVKYEYGVNNNLNRVILVPDSSNFIYHPNMEAYEITGYISHQADRTLYQVIMRVKYFDDDNVLLVEQENYFYDVIPNVQNDFLLKFDDINYFETVKKVKFSFNLLE